ncbi:site-specific integrase [Aquitalea sp. ASV15]|uniref:tyrosine-type recombinase/integrase n=1 Tax=Aquitalea sp. ASV15 TaxID=2795104 RepID=UPI0018EC8905
MAFFTDVDMELIWATNSFKINGVTYAGFPILLHDSMRGVSEVNSFLRYYLVERGRVGSNKTWLVVGQALYDYYGFLQAHDLRWDKVCLGESSSIIAAYRDYCLRTVKLSRNTVRQRLNYVCKFYEYAAQHKWISDVPFHLESVFRGAADNLFSHIDSSGGMTLAKDVMPKSQKLLPKLLSRDEIRLLLSVPCNRHHKMILRMGLHTGMRRQEIATFPVDYVFDPATSGQTARNIQIWLDPNDGTGMQTKGSRPRNITISRNFMSDLWQYHVHVRGERARLSGQQHHALFLNQFGEPFAAGGKRLERIIREIGNLVGVDVHPHKLRHTYATYTLHALQGGKRSFEPLVFLQQQLGHVSIQTTMIYAHLVDSLVDDAVLAFDEEITNWCTET